MARGKLGLVLILLVFIAVSTAAGNEAVLSDELLLFGTEGTQPIHLDSNHGWILVGTIDWPQSWLSSSAEVRRYRLRSRYEHASSGAPSTIQIRTRNQSAVSVFTHPWAQSAESSSESYSNWYEDFDGKIEGGQSLVEARLISPPRTPIAGKLYSVTLETWIPVETRKDSRSEAPNVQLAYTRPLPIFREKEPIQSRDEMPGEALEFALEFVEASIKGDLAVFYRSHAQKISSLADGSIHSKYHVIPPEEIPGIENIDDYRRRFDYKLYDRMTFKTLFPEWFDESRQWIPPEDAYLFIGHRDRQDRAELRDIDYLVFMTARNEDGDWKIVARPEF